ncbi:MAG: hypothetical protein HYX24_07030 [Candidatus Aenigmarchaeota archaeon]|nr:hypothetical protein [Candidatus Aenigmarchaeota archaeon]
MFDKSRKAASGLSFFSSEILDEMADVIIAIRPYSGSRRRGETSPEGKHITIREDMRPTFRFDSSMPETKIDEICLAAAQSTMNHEAIGHAYFIHKGEGPAYVLKWTMNLIGLQREFEEALEKYHRKIDGKKVVDYNLLAGDPALSQAVVFANLLEEERAVCTEYWLSLQSNSYEWKLMRDVAIIESKEKLEPLRRLELQSPFGHEMIKEFRNLYV